MSVTGKNAWAADKLSFVALPTKMTIETNTTTSNLGNQDCEDDVKTLIANGVTQKIYRAQIDNCDRIVGLYRCDFESGQDRFVMNIPVHPPLNELPEVQAVTIDGSARTRITNREKFGVRLEVVRADNLATASAVFIEVIISCLSGSNNDD